jgi:hypothetical protein
MADWQGRLADRIKGTAANRHSLRPLRFQSIQAPKALHCEELSNAKGVEGQPFTNLPYRIHLYCSLFPASPLTCPRNCSRNRHTFPMKQPFAVLESHWGPHGLLPPPPPPRPRNTAHPYQGARTKRAFAAQRQLDIDGVVRTPFINSNTYHKPDDVRDCHHLRLTSLILDAPS